MLAVSVDLCLLVSGNSLYTVENLESVNIETNVSFACVLLLHL